MNYYIYYIFFIIGLIEIINAIIVESENDILNNLSKSEDKVTLNINSEIDITKEINISSSIQKLSIIGNSLNSSKINLRHLLYFNSTIKEIEIKNIYVNGNLFFNNNEKITIDVVKLNGYIDSNFNEKSHNSIEITKFIYKPTEELVKNCINLSGNIKINKSKFHGNASCKDRLLYYNGFEKYTFDLKESSFNGEYECPFLNIENVLNANIETSYFEKGYSSKNNEGGGGIRAISSNVKIQNCTFNDILSYDSGGAFNLINNYNVNGSNLNFNNVTSLGLGSIFQISSHDPSLLIFNNITQKNTGNMKFMREGGLIMNIKGKAIVNITSYYAENLINTNSSGSAFSLSENAKLTIKDVYIKNLIGNGDHGGLFYTSKDSLNVEFIANNVTLYNLYQSNRHSTSIIYIENNNHAYMEGVKVFNSGGYNTYFIRILHNSYVNLTNFEVDNFESKTNKEFIHYESDINYHYFYKEDMPKNTISNFKVSNVISRGVLFVIKNGVFNINDCEFRNIHECYKYNNCTSMESEKYFIKDVELLLAHGGKNTEVSFTYINIDQMYGDNGILLFTANASVIHSNVSNSYFKTGFIHMDELHKNELNYENGAHTISDSTFENNTSECGTIFNFPYLSTGKDKIIKVSNSKFINNTASKFGGVIYSVGENNDESISFTNCYFYNNHAKLGNIMYTRSKNALPYIGSYKLTDISTIPTYFKMYGNTVKEISILSGENIPEGIKFKLFDDFGNQIFFPQKTNNIQFDDLVLFNVEINDTYNAQVLGQTKNYCWDESCILPSVKVIGNPGIYTLSLKLKSFGIYPKFIQDSVDIKIKIRDCNKPGYLNQALDNINIKSCYIPKCKYECNGGICINNDLCNCNITKFEGKYCNEYIKLERNYSIDTFLITVLSVIIFIIIVLIEMTNYYRDNLIIKGGGIEFLIIILIGLIVNCVNAIFLTIEKTIKICYLTYLLSNMGFSFVFGSIFIKSYRIYLIFCKRIRIYMGIKKKNMFLIIFLMTFFHCMMAILWHTSKRITIINDYTADNKEFVRCKYPNSKHLSSLFNFIILMFEFVLSYSIRRVEKIYKEALVIPAYAYIFYMLLIYIMENQKGINIIIQDYFEIIGTIINTLITTYDLYIIKFINIFAKKDMKTKRKSISIPLQ